MVSQKIVWWVDSLVLDSIMLIEPCSSLMSMFQVGSTQATMHPYLCGFTAAAIQRAARKTFI